MIFVAAAGRSTISTSGFAYSDALQVVSGKNWMPTPIPLEFASFKKPSSALEIAAHLVTPVPVFRSIEPDWSIMKYKSSGARLAVCVLDAHVQVPCEQPSSLQSMPQLPQ